MGALVKALFVGYGSIGRRHVTNLRALVPDAHITAVRRSAGDTPPDVDRVVNALYAVLKSAR